MRVQMAIAAALLLLLGCGEEGEGFVAPECYVTLEQAETRYVELPNGGFELSLRAHEGREVLEFPFETGELGVSTYISGVAELGVFELEIFSPRGTLVHRAALWEGNGQEGLEVPWLEPEAGTWSLVISQRRACGWLQLQVR